MRKFLNKFLGQLCIAATLTGVASAADVDKKITDRIDAATAVVRELMATPDKGVPLWVAAKATCVLVVPGYKKGAFIVGGQYGQGLATCRNHHRWSAPVFIQITGASFGFQAGRNSQASLPALANAEFLTYSRSKGLFAGLDLTGDYINQNKDDTAAYYGTDIHYSNILSGKVPTKASSRRFIAAVSQLFRE